MKYQIENFKISPKQDKNLYFIISKKYNLKDFKYKILHKSIDARDKENIKIIYKLMIDTPTFLKGKYIAEYKEDKIILDYPNWTSVSPIIVGFGPAGMFAALYLARCNAKPIIIERGGSIEQRKKDVEIFIKEKILNKNSNIQFGEGGAGAFSDGKLVTNIKDPLIRFILNEFYIHGAKEDILYESKPHIGTDYLEKIVKNIRIEIEKLGGKFYFNHIFLDAKPKDNGLMVYTNKMPEPLYTEHLLLGLGHSARDTIRHLYSKMHLHMEQKAFSMGVRIEHPAKLINESQYSHYAKDLPTAYYKLATHKDGRGIYTFCMCPGGYVLCSSSEEDSIVTNGMSNNKRDGNNSNSAILVDIRPEDYNKGSTLDGIDFQEKYEQRAFQISKDYRAPANLVKEFLEGAIAKQYRSVIPSYPHNICLCDLRKCLPDYVVEGIKYGIKEFDKRLKGFAYDDAILIGIESRSSSPVRILRDGNFQSNIKGIYPIGEGAGYAGGITSAALDGLKIAIHISKALK